MKKHFVPYTASKSNRQCFPPPYQQNDPIYQRFQNTQTSFLAHCSQHNQKLLNNINNCQRNDSKNYNIQCSRCSQTRQKLVRCINCYGRWLCLECSQLVHSTGKFQFHKIIGNNQPQIKSKSKSTKGILRKNSQSTKQQQFFYDDQNKKPGKVLFGTPKIKNKQLTEQIDNIVQFQLLETQIQQNWAKVARNLKLKFEEILDSLKDKLIALQKQMGLRKQRQISELKEKLQRDKLQNKINPSKGFTNSPIIAGKVQSRFMFSPQNTNYLINQLNENSQQPTYEVGKQYFEQLATIIKKMELKTIIKRENQGSKQKYFASRDRNKLQKSSNNKSHVLISDNIKKFEEQKKGSQQIHKKIISMANLEEKNLKKHSKYSETCSKNTNSDLSVTNNSFKGLEQQQVSDFSKTITLMKSPLAKFQSQKYIWNDIQNQPQHLFQKSNTFIKKAKNRDGIYDRDRSQAN